MKKIVVLTLLIVGLAFFFWPGHPPNQFLMGLISKSPQQGKTSETISKNGLDSHQIPSFLNFEFAGVTKEDENKIREGIRIMDFYLNNWFGHSITNKASYKVDSSNQNGDSFADGPNGEIIVFIHTQDKTWQMIRQFTSQYNMDLRGRLAAHEYIHLYQADNGCGKIYNPNQPRLKWLMEGEAEWLSWKAMMDSGNIPSFLGLEQMLSIPLQGGNLLPLKTYEKTADIDVQLYSYFALATNFLMKDRDIKTLDNFCANVGKGQEPSVAFENAFGVPLAKFYSNFETYRQNLGK